MPLAAACTAEGVDAAAEEAGDDEEEEEEEEEEEGKGSAARAGWMGGVAPIPMPTPIPMGIPKPPAAREVSTSCHEQVRALASSGRRGSAARHVLLPPRKGSCCSPRPGSCTPS